MTVFIFDLDGTLIDSRRRHWMLMSEILKHHGIVIEKNFSDDYMYYKSLGFSSKKYLVEVFNIPVSKAEYINNQWMACIENERWLSYDTLYHDSLSTLEQINDPIVFLTLRNNKIGLENELHRLSLDKYPCICLNHNENKADILKKFDDKVIMIGDSEKDYYAALSNNIRFYMLNRGFRCKKYWDEKGVVSYPDLSFLLTSISEK